MSEEQIKKVSNFQQFDRAYYEQQGVGLGLLIAKMLAERERIKSEQMAAQKKKTQYHLSKEPSKMNPCSVMNFGM